ncbi:flagellar basal-body rod protein FlgG [Heliorestis acidaminivorans]|uniref:Flagellar basal-body rod protein FlgG n=1 Tax=Heliorestis acidaminivorans TaxID=553427 RepID=A0A6I0F4M6_9FIRM|nr:flagellar basal-body rod protein FlgG [Heliorestis acidaminivorans]KAB2953792.1 flagellar basal-body rod protein FlgG [Heliorestis acidaminivorans]
MIRALYSASTGMKAQQLNIDTIANNLANVNTFGYKKSRAEFQDLLYQNLRTATMQNPTGMQVGMGVKPSSITTITTNGNLIQTENPTDIAIMGQGYFQLVNPMNDAVPYYTRDGSFKLDVEGNLVTADGYILDGIAPLPEGAYDINITAEGMVTFRDADGDGELAEAGQIPLFMFNNPAGLTKAGRNLLLASEASGEAVEGFPGEQGRGTLAQSFLESSNVQVVEEMVAMITAQRAYEVNTKTIQTSDEMLSQANTLKR